ncbi:hypothetical protein ACWDOM_14815, partial [Streptomyces prasinus]
ADAGDDSGHIGDLLPGVREGGPAAEAAPVPEGEPDGGRGPGPECGPGPEQAARAPEPMAVIEAPSKARRVGECIDK